MGNAGSSGVNGRRRTGSGRTHAPPPPPPPHPEIPGNRYVFAAATPYPSQYPNHNPSSYYQYPGYYLPPGMSAPYAHSQMGPPNFGARYPCGPVMPPPLPYVEHQKAVTIRNDVNLKKETLRLEPDEDNPGEFLVTFTFDATVAGSITVIFFAEEGESCNLTPTKEDIFPPVTVHFEQGLGQKFRQPSGTGIDFSKIEEKELLKHDDMDIYPLAVKAEADPKESDGNAASSTTNSQSESDGNAASSTTNFQNESDGNEASSTTNSQNESVGNATSSTTNSQITKAVFEKEKDGYQVRVVKQILWVSGMRYELQEIYGIGNSIGRDSDANEPGKECVICLSEPRDTTVLPCRHMCLCSGCAKVLRFQMSRCPICRQPVDRLLEIKVNNGADE